MQHADDVLRLLAPERNAGIFGRQHLPHQLLRRQVGIDGDHFGAMNHDVGDLQLAQVEQPAEHVAVHLLHLAFAVQQIDRAAQPLDRRQDRLVGADLDAQGAHQDAHHDLDHGEQGSQHGDRETHRTRHPQSEPVGRVERHGLGQHLREDHHHRSHARGRIEHADFAEPRREDAGGKRRCADIGDVVAEQKRADQTVAMAAKKADTASSTITIEIVSQPIMLAIAARYLPHPSFVTRKSRTGAGSTSFAMTARPIASRRMKVNLPRLTFLSWAISAISVSASARPSWANPAISCRWVGSPASARCRSIRTASAGGIMPSDAENSAASTMPIATPSPWNSRSEKPVTASSAWPNVWPRLSSARSPVSRSSRATMAALARQEVAIACSRAAPPLTMSA